MGWTLEQSWIVYSPGNLPIPVNQSGNSLIKLSVDLMGLAASGAAVGFTVVAVGAGTGPGGFMSGWITVMAQFILTTPNLLHDGRPRMAGLGESVTYQYEFTLLGQVPGLLGCQMMGLQSAQ